MLSPSTRLLFRRASFVLGALSGVILLAIAPLDAGARDAPQATLGPTVTGTAAGPSILVPDEVNVRLGPGTDYDLVGVC